MSISPRMSVPVVKYEQSKHIVLMIYLFLNKNKKLLIYFLIKKREKPLDSDVKTQQQRKTNKNNKKLSKHSKAKSSHSPGPTTFSPAKSLA